MSEMMEVYCHDVRKARKEHNCVECRGTIFKGEFYHYHHGVFDGEGISHKECNDCYDLRALIDKDVVHGEELTEFEHLYESVFEGGALEHMRTYLLTKEKRGARIQQWMKDRFDDELSKQDEKIEENLTEDQVASTISL